MFLYTYAATVDGKSKRRQREVGLGSVGAVSLAKARKLAEACREARADGRDPREALRAPESRTFLAAATACMKSRGVEAQCKASARQWERTVGETCRALHHRDVATITRADVLDILTPIWDATPETARRVRSRLEIILDYARGRDWREGENPARWRGNLDAVLRPIDKRNASHHAAMAIDALPAFMADLRDLDTVAARALELTILTASRTSEVLLAEPGEFDLANATWTRPAHRMKARREHTVPLAPRAVEVVRPLLDLGGTHVFPGQKPGHPLSNMTMAMLLRRMGVEKGEATVHGFRSTFRDWCGNRTTFPRELAEHALAHVIGNRAELAYRRGQALERRREVMERWAEHCAGEGGADVVALYG